MKLFFIIFLFIIWGCSSAEKPVAPDNDMLKPINEYHISVPEPSGLCYDSASNSLWTVSDETGSVYQLNLNGNVIKTISLPGLLDLEAVCLNGSGDSLWIVNEQLREFIKIDFNGNISQRKQILSGDDNSGLEGICINSNNGHIFTIKEKDPGMLIELSSDLTIINQKEITFANDFSGMTWNLLDDQLIIVSHQSKKIFFCNTVGEVIKSYDIQVKQGEGIAIDPANNKIYVVSDSDSKLYVYELNEFY